VRRRSASFEHDRHDGHGDDYDRGCEPAQPMRGRPVACYSDSG
jgi:hypothetical protein